VNIRLSYLWLCKIPLFRPHHSIMYADAACWGYCYRPSSVVCLSFRHSIESCKNGWSDRDAVWVEDSGWPKEPCIRWGPDRPWNEVILKGKEAACCKVAYSDYAVSCAKTAELNWSWSRLGFRLWWAQWISIVTHWRNLANTIEPSMISGDAVCTVKLLWARVN